MQNSDLHVHSIFPSSIQAEFIQYNIQFKVKANQYSSLPYHYSQASLVPKLVRQIANAWKAERGRLKSIVKVSSPTFPNCSNTVSSSPFPPGWLWSIVATSWKFLTEATVTLPWKFKHQHSKCSCHLGALFFKIVQPVLIFKSSWDLSGSERGHVSEHIILRGPLDFKRLNLYETCPITKLLDGTWGLICLFATRRPDLLLDGFAPLCGGWLSYNVKLVPRKSDLAKGNELCRHQIKITKMRVFVKVILCNTQSNIV